MKFRAAQKKAVEKFDDPEFIANIKEEDSTMIKHLDILKQINQHGYLTTNSQAGRKTISIYERAYIIGFMLKKDALEFIKNMNIETDKNAIMIEQNGLKIETNFDIALSIEKKINGKYLHTCLQVYRQAIFTHNKHNLISILQKKLSIYFVGIQNGIETLHPNMVFLQKY